VKAFGRTTLKTSIWKNNFFLFVAVVGLIGCGVKPAQQAIPRPLAATTKDQVSFGRIRSVLDTAKALQAQGRLHGSQAKYSEALALLSQCDGAQDSDLVRIRKLEAAALEGMRGNLPYALSVAPDNDASEEVDGLALLDSIQQGDIPLSSSDSAKYMREFLLDTATKFDLPIEANSRVLSAIALFKDRIPKHFGIWMARKGRYESMIREKFKAAGLPQDLVYLAMIESGFNPKAYSPAAASGLWQFLAASGKRFGLRVDRFVDDRRDPERATDAAIQYLSFLYNRFGDWNLAMAAYNCGEGCIDRVIKRSGQPHPSYWEVGLPSETRDYVPRIYAAAVLSKNPAAHGFNIVPWSPFPTDTFTVEGGLALQKIAEALHCSADTLATLNPALTRKMTPPRKDPYLLRLPAGAREAFAMIYPNLEKSFSAPEPSRWVHRIRKGETIGSIAARYGVSSQEIRAWNRLGKRKIRPGKTLVIYGDPTDSRIGSEESTSARKRKRGATASEDEEPAAISTTHRVHSGETLASIASRYKTTAAAIKNANHLRGNSVRVGQKLRIPAPAAAETGRSRKDSAKAGGKAAAKATASKGTKNYRVRKGDSLFSIARQSSTTVDEILSINGMKNNRIRPGQVLKLPTGG